MRITVFTSTYNRACFLERVWRSLDEQRFEGMEWIVVDDGSDDGTEEVVRKLKEDSRFDITYYRQERGGKHRAINRGVEMSRGELFFIVDSDDWLTEGALERVWNEWMKVEDKESFAGVCGVDVTPERVKIGGGLGMESVDSDLVEIQNRYHVMCDLKEVFRTSVLREYPFPEIEGEMFCPEQLVWYRIAQKYKMRFFDEGIYVAEYQEGGLTDKIIKVRRESPVASMMTYAEALKCAISFGGKVRSAINYWRFRGFGGDRGVRVGWEWLWCAPLGYIMNIKDSMVCR